MRTSSFQPNHNSDDVPVCVPRQTKNLEEILKHHGNGESDAPNKSLHSKAEELGEGTGRSLVYHGF